MSIISSHTGFQPLKEVWLGDSYPDNFFEQLKNSKLRDLCLNINEKTKQDLNKIEKLIESFDVKVCRPKFESVDHYLDEQGNLLKPPITPRDWAFVLGSTLYVLPEYSSGVQPFASDIKRYIENKQNVKILDRFSATPQDWCWVVFPGFVRLGRDLFIDYDPNRVEENKAIQNIAKTLAKSYRVHLGTEGDHSDGVFCPVRPNTIVSSHYRSDYSKGWPGWQTINLPDTTPARNGENGKWWVPGVDLGHFNDQMLYNIRSWLGNYSETVFEVNMLVIDEKNVLVLAYDDYVCLELEKLGITCHVVDFRTRGFWDGGLHCLTLDIHRLGECIDYWPDRGPFGIDYNH